MDDLGTYFTGLGVLIALIALFVSSSANKKANKIQEEIRKIEHQRFQWESKERAFENLESSKASLVAHLAADKLTIANKGQSEAQNMQIEIEKIDDVLISGELEAFHKTERLKSGDQVSLISGLNDRSPNPIILTLKWTDAFDENRKNSQKLKW